MTTAAVGNATLTLDRGARTISATITIDGLAPTLAHIHGAEPARPVPSCFR